jgi:hypothetical protein
VEGKEGGEEVDGVFEGVFGRFGNVSGWVWVCIVFFGYGMKDVRDIARDSIVKYYPLLTMTSLLKMDVPLYMGSKLSETRVLHQASSSSLPQRRWHCEDSMRFRTFWCFR